MDTTDVNEGEYGYSLSYCMYKKTSKRCRVSAKYRIMGSYVVRGNKINE